MGRRRWRGSRGGPRRTLVTHRLGIFLTAFLAVTVTSGGFGLPLPGPSVEVVGGTPQQRLTLERSVALYAEAGLELPPVTVELSDDTGACNASHGGFQRWWPRHRIRVCTDSLEIMVHELAHAWVYHNLDVGERALFARVRGAVSWTSKSVPWRHRASEHAAEILTWGLVRFPEWQVRVFPRDRASLSAALDFLLDHANEPLLSPVEPL